MRRRPCTAPARRGQLNAADRVQDAQGLLATRHLQLTTAVEEAELAAYAAGDLVTAGIAGLGQFVANTISPLAGPFRMDMIRQPVADALLVEFRHVHQTCEVGVVVMSYVSRKKLTHEPVVVALQAKPR